MIIFIFQKFIGNQYSGYEIDEDVHCIESLDHNNNAVSTKSNNFDDPDLFFSNGTICKTNKIKCLLDNHNFDHHFFHSNKSLSQN